MQRKGALGTNELIDWFLCNGKRGHAVNELSAMQHNFVLHQNSSNIFQQRLYVDKASSMIGNRSPDFASNIMQI